MEGTEKEINDGLAHMLFVWLEEIDGENSTWWYKHVVKENFSCGCRFDYSGEDGVEFNYCPWWKQNRHRVTEPGEAWVQAHYEQRRKYGEDWFKAQEINRQYDRLLPIYESYREQQGYNFFKFLQQIMP